MGLLTQSYHDATGGGWASPHPNYSHEANQILKTPDSVLNSTINTSSVLAAISYQIKNPVGVAVFIGTGLAAQGIKFQKEGYNLNDIVSESIKTRMPSNASYFLNNAIDKIISGEWDGNALMWLILEGLDSMADNIEEKMSNENLKCKN